MLVLIDMGIWCLLLSVGLYGLLLTNLIGGGGFIREAGSGGCGVSRFYWGGVLLGFWFFISRF